MGFRGSSVRDQRVEFVIRASRGESLSVLCREYGVSRPTGYLWLRRFQQEGIAGMAERSHRPHSSPGQTAAAVEQRIEQLRRQRPDWGARKLAALLAQEGTPVPVITVHRVLSRRGLVFNQPGRRQATQRFERELPNQLWQMDFKGQKEAAAHIGPLSVLDDHSRYLVGLEQIGNTSGDAVRERLEGLFREHGVPDAMLMDHGVPWWSAHSNAGWTFLSVWLMQQGIRCCWSGFRHPQTQGKVERFHGALERARRRPGGQHWLEQYWLDAFRHEYNHLRPHEALQMKTPASCWTPSMRAYDPNPPRWDYGEGAEVRRVDSIGHIYVNNHAWHVSKALITQTVALERIEDRVLVFFCDSLVSEIDLTSQRTARAVRWLNSQNCKGSPDNSL
jgi:transposase InsO family protein